MAAGVEVGVLGMEDAWLRVVGAIVARVGIKSGFKCRLV